MQLIGDGQRSALGESHEIIGHQRAHGVQSRLFVRFQGEEVDVERVGAARDGFALVDRQSTAVAFQETQIRSGTDQHHHVGHLHPLQRSVGALQAHLPVAINFRHLKTQKITFHYC